MIEIIKLLRINQWTKNSFIFAPLFFSGHLLDIEMILVCLVAFALFSFNASSIYIINDLKDVEKDKLHPVKKNRPFAKGTVSKNLGFILFILFSLSSLVLAFIFNTNFFFVLLFYFVMNIIYSMGLKKVSLVDILIISVGFVLRVTAGGVVTGIEISQWLYIMTFLIALFIAFAKRRDDVLIEMQTGEQMRKSISGYNLEFITSAISILCGVLIVSYLLYVTSFEITERFKGKPVFISTIFVIVGILRYLQITLVEKNSGSPTKILAKDRFIQFIIAGWVLFFAFIIYFK